jgi:hypothetical protein
MNTTASDLITPIDSVSTTPQGVNPTRWSDGTPVTVFQPPAQFRGESTKMIAAKIAEVF